MTSDEHRAKCIEAMERGWLAHFGITKPNPPLAFEAMAAAFDALHGIARVNPIEATEEMVHGHLDPVIGGYPPSDCAIIFRAMSARGDLTNPPEEKP